VGTIASARAVGVIGATVLVIVDNVRPTLIIREDNEIVAAVELIGVSAGMLQSARAIVAATLAAELETGVKVGILASPRNAGATGATALVMGDNAGMLQSASAIVGA
jgi:hypothetical protein